MSNATATVAEPEVLLRPRLASNVSVHAPSEEGGPWVLQHGDQRYFRVQADMAKLLRAVDGERDHTDLASALGPPWTADVVGFAVQRLANNRLLEDGTRRPRVQSWIKFVPPLTVQFTVLKPERLLRLLAPIANVVATRAGMGMAAFVAVGGLLTLLGRGSAVTAALGRPLPLAAYLGVAVGAFATTVVHEFSHGATLRHFGGMPSRMGLMLLYMSPSFFCDVSDGWRLPRSGQRVRVALAGVGVQWVVAGGGALATLTLADSPLRDGVFVFSTVTYIAGLLNLTPFVKLDGYLALMSHLDIPHLRDRAMSDARRLLARLLFGGRYARELPQLSWAQWYGLACMAFPVYIIVGALSLWLDVLQRLGVVGAFLSSLGFGYLLFAGGRGFVRLVREARGAVSPHRHRQRRGGRHRQYHQPGGRIASVALLLACGSVWAMLIVDVPYTITGGYLQRPDGVVELALSTSVDQAAIRPGSEVRLYTAGVVRRKQTGSAEVADGTIQRSTAPISAFFPVRADSVPIAAVTTPLIVRSAPAESTGLAQVDAGNRPLWNWLYNKYVAPSWRW